MLNSIEQYLVCISLQLAFVYIYLFKLSSPVSRITAIIK